jgi:CRISPR-associated protein Cmr3
MSTAYLELAACDPIVARDGRPFGVGQGNRMRGLDWPFPSVVAGSFRTALGKAAQREFDETTSKSLFQVEVSGVFPVANGELYLPSPADCLWDKKSHVIHRVVPSDLKVNEGEGADFPVSGLRPVMLPMTVEDFKPEEPPAWWPRSKVEIWLTHSTIKPDKPLTFDSSFLLAAKPQMRDHVQLDADSGAAAESRLFATAGLDLTHLRRYHKKDSDDKKTETNKLPFGQRFTEIGLAARAQAEGWPELDKLDTLHPLGGERRLVHWKAGGNPKLWECPETVSKALKSADKVRMVLATPAIFSGGWRPGWLDPVTLKGRPPARDKDSKQPELTLVGVSIQRWKAVSGWSLAKPCGPKAIRRLVPAGGVYFFETKDNAATLADQWLQPVSDNEQDRRDGFGLAVWGTWGHTSGGNG